MTDFAASYGASLYSLCKDDEITGRVYSELKELVPLLDEKYCALLDSPMIPLEKRLSLADEALSGRVCEYVQNFIKLLTEKKALYKFGECVKSFEAMYNKDNNIEIVTAVTAFPMTDELKDKLSKKLSGLINKKVVVNNKTDSTMIGGLVVRFSDTQIDSSVKSRLESIKSQIGGRMV